MKKITIFLFITLAFSALYSCQDEFCLDATTPSLIIRLYSKDTITKPKSLNLVVWANNKDVLLYSGTAVDSLVLPLDTQNNTVIYHLAILNKVDNSISSSEDITIDYTTEDVFVSKACGYKSIFNDVTISATNNHWIDHISVSITEITNENEAHVKIYH